MMPDLTIETMQMCAQLEHSVHHIGGYTQIFSVHQQWPECTCPAFKYSRHKSVGCKHILDAELKRCTWHQQFDEPQTEPGICPQCGGPTVPVRVGV